jgi:hypothetical protein
MCKIAKSSDRCGLGYPIFLIDQDDAIGQPISQFCQTAAGDSQTRCQRLQPRFVMNDFGVAHRLPQRLIAAESACKQLLALGIEDGPNVRDARGRLGCDHLQRVQPDHMGANRIGERFCHGDADPQSRERARAPCYRNQLDVLRTPSHFR